MTDEIKIYHADDPDDAPERRISAYPTINAFVPPSLPQYVIPPVANSLYTAMQYYWYSAYQQGVAAQKHQQQQLNHQQQHHQHHQHAHQQQQQQQVQHQAVAKSPSNHLSSQHHHQHHHPHHHQAHHQTHQQHLHQNQELNHHHLNSQHHTPNHQVASPSSSIGLTSASSSTSSTCSSSTSSSSTSSSSTSSCSSSSSTTTNTSHIKKPLNPFMIYMQKRRPDIVRQGVIKESAAINQLLGQQWRQLSKEEQEPYYKLAEEEKRLHSQRYPGWSARDNYANQKKKKKMKLKSTSTDHSDKKCRARFGLNDMASWCKPCRRKKKCIFVKKSII